MSEAEAWVMIPKLDKYKTGCVLDMHPLVLCKDCRYNDDGECIIKAGWFPVKPEWFCADGVKREC